MNTMPSNLRRRMTIDLGVKIWYDISAVSGLVDTNPIQFIPDLSENRNDAWQNTASKRLVYREAQINGMPAAVGDGVDDNMHIFLNNQIVGPFATYYLVLKGNVIYTGFDRNILVPNNDIDFLRFAMPNSTGQDYMRMANGANLEAVGNEFIPDLNWHVWSCIFNTSSSLMIRDGRIAASGNAGANSAAVTYYTLFDANQTEGNVWSGAMTELIVCQGAHNLNQYSKTIKYLGRKYKIKTAA